MILQYIGKDIRTIVSWVCKIFTGPKVHSSVQGSQSQPGLLPYNTPIQHPTKSRVCLSNCHVPYSKHLATRSWNATLRLALAYIGRVRQGQWDYLPLLNAHSNGQYGEDR